MVKYVNVWLPEQGENLCEYYTVSSDGVGEVKQVTRAQLPDVINAASAGRKIQETKSCNPVLAGVVFYDFL